MSVIKKKKKNYRQCSHARVQIWAKNVCIPTHVLFIQKKNKAVKFGISNVIFLPKKKSHCCDFLVCLLACSSLWSIVFFPPHPATVLASGKLTAFALGLKIPLNH